ncbi:MAG: alpha-amylase family glycosyl hydrolase [Ferruginibacter sp.]
MKKLSLAVFAIFIFINSHAQRLLSWTQEFPTDATGITVTVDCNKGNQGLLNFEGGASNNVYVHVGVITNLSSGPSDWRYVPFTWGTTPAAAKAVPLGANKYQYTISNIRSFFGVPAGETIQKMTIIFRTATGSLKQVNSDGSDMYIPIYNGNYAVRINLPPFEPRYVPWVEPISATVGQNISITGVASQNSNLSLSLNGSTVGSATAANTITASPTLTTSCEQKVILTGDNGTSIAKDSFSFFIAPGTITEALPTGVQDGINYISPTSVTLVLFAPNKTSVVVIGDFSNWQSTCANQMKRTPDGTRYHITLTGLTPGTIYKYQYVVDGNLKIADPYSELILDPSNDQFISSSTYPSMPAYPANQTTGIVSTFQPSAPVYNWSNNAYTRPDKKNMVAYELLIRDFVAARNFQTVIDTLNYLQRLGINTIELMPVNEFEGNLSWGYNPDYFFAPDKAYGTKNNLKRLIDSAHSKGMAVVIDAVLNHATGLSPLAQLYWNNTNNTPAANSPFFNISATHPFSVFNDFNHESEATKYMVSRFIRHWLTEYRIDGFRWDLSKGFTQRVSTDVGAWNAYDASRVAIWQRYYDSMQVVSSGSYCILEHLGNDDEESDLANRGMMLWGKMTEAYNQNTMGYASNSDINRAFARNRAGWNNLHLVTYAESHDEERIMYKNLVFGNSTNTAHDVKNLQVALARTEAMMPFLLLIPGPKMLWEFQELGYDKSIFMCENGTVPTPYGNEQCKLAPKPPLWNYYAEAGRRKIYDVVAGLNALRKSKPNTFLSNSISGNLGNTLQKVLIITHPDLSVVTFANFDVTLQNVTVTFPSSGTWYNYFTGATFSATGAAQNISMAPGEYRVYVNQLNCSTAAPTAASPISYCQNATAAALTATGTNLLWYTTATGGTGSATAPTPSTATIGSTTYYVSQTVGCESPRTPIVVTINALPAAPTVNSTVSYCQNATPSALTATGTNLLWYTTATGGTGTALAPTPSTTVIGSTIYYVSQTIGGCESPRAGITVNITATTAAPAVTSPVNYCQNATPAALTATGTNLLWYTTATGGTGSATAPTPGTSTIGSVTYYVSQTQSCGESPRAAIVVNVNALPAAPSATTSVSYCQNATAAALTASGTNLLWYTTATGGTGTATAPTPLTNTVGTVSYYVSQSSGGCESPRTAITVTTNAIPAAPAATSPVSYCQNATATALTATGSNLLWYTTATGGTGSGTAPTPVTSTVGSTNYYVSQTSNGCEGPRATITVNITASTAAPTVSSPVNYCQNATAVALTATGTNLLWYTTATGGTGSATAPTPSTAAVGSTTYYVSQTQSCGESPRAAIAVNITAIPAAPSATTAISYCQNATASALTASGTNLLWYTTATGGTGSAAAPTPSTTAAGSISYYVSQTVSSCESPRTTIVVTVNALPSAPAVSSPVSYCQNTTAAALTATGTNLLWYTTATGGTGSATAPTPSTSSVGSVNYYVSQTSNGCEGPRATITVNITASTVAPGVNSPVNYCQNAAAVALTATGTNLLWYTTATGGTGSATAPTVSTATVGSITYYVSQTGACGEGPRAAIIVNINAIPGMPSVSGTVSYCQNASAAALTATGTNLLWYTVATGGTGSSAAPTPSTTAAGTTNYYVSQTINGCEGPRAAISVTVNALPAAPVATATVSYCQNAAATALTATGTNLLWYTAATGGTGSSSAPTPSTAAAGTTNYYVSQTVNGCEGPRASVAVTVTALPAAPVVTPTIIYCQNAIATELDATGSGLLWYTTATGGTGSVTAPIPPTNAAGNTNYYVAQTNPCGEGPRAMITVIVNPTPASPASLNSGNISTNSATVSWTGTAGSSYYLQYKEASAATWITAATGITNTTFEITGLAQGVTYDWRVSSNCDGSNSGNYSTAQFTTSSRDNTITNIKNGIGIKISPNPLVNTAVIDYSVSENGTVSISVFDPKGQLVVKLFEANRSPGQYSLNIINQFKKLANGAYYLRVQQNKKRNTILFVKTP